MRHVLKTHPEPFESAWAGQKPFELRADDRRPRFAVGDRVVLREWDPLLGEELPRYIAARIGSIVRDRPRWGLRPGFCVLGLLDPTFRDCGWSESGFDHPEGQSVQDPAVAAPPAPAAPSELHWAALDSLDRLVAEVRASIVTGRFPDPEPTVSRALVDAETLLIVALQGPVAAGEGVSRG